MKGELAIIDKTGDTKLIWDTDAEAEVRTARDTFNKLKKEGYVGYTVNAKGGKSEVLHEFDAEAGKIIMAPTGKTVGG